MDRRGRQRRGGVLSDPQPPAGVPVSVVDEQQAQRPFMEEHGNDRLQVDAGEPLQLDRGRVGTALQLAGAAGAAGAGWALGGWPVALLVVSLVLIAVGVIVEMGR